MVKDEEYQGFTIKLKHLPQYREWLATIRDSDNQTIVSDYHGSEEIAREWAQNIIRNIKSVDNTGISENA